LWPNSSILKAGVLRSSRYCIACKPTCKRGGGAFEVVTA
jgi:hypothetical protein